MSELTPCIGQDCGAQAPPRDESSPTPRGWASVFGHAVDSDVFLKGSLCPACQEKRRNREAPNVTP